MKTRSPDLEQAEPRNIDYQERTRRHNLDHPGLIPGNFMAISSTFTCKLCLDMKMGLVVDPSYY